MDGSTFPHCDKFGVLKIGLGRGHDHVEVESLKRLLDERGMLMDWHRYADRENIQPPFVMLTDIESFLQEFSR